VAAHFLYQQDIENPGFYRFSKSVKCSGLDYVCVTFPVLPGGGTVEGSGYCGIRLSCTDVADAIMLVAAK
jgi:hypothetical protein